VIEEVVVDGEGEVGGVRRGLPVLQPEARIITGQHELDYDKGRDCRCAWGEALVLRTIFIASPVDLIGSDLNCWMQ